jgi:uncharacterized protein with PIN domain/sulfur carrier protein ThiS
MPTKLNKYATLRFYEELNDFLPESKRKKRYKISISARQSVKDLIESQGIPHTEIDLILVNSKPVKLDHIVQDGDDITVYPVFESFDISTVTPIENRPLRDPKFVLDVHLGRLAKYLRVMGFDTLYRNDYSDIEIVEISLKEKRIILTRDKGLLMRNAVQRGYWVRNTSVRAQASEVIRRFNFFSLISPFKRCIECNGLIEPVSKESVMDLLQPGTRKYFNEFFRCTGCMKVYWKGSHYGRMNEFIINMMNEKNNNGTRSYFNT